MVPTFLGIIVVGVVLMIIQARHQRKRDRELAEMTEEEARNAGVLQIPCKSCSAPFFTRPLGRWHLGFLEPKCPTCGKAAKGRMNRVGRITNWVLIAFFVWVPFGNYTAMRAYADYALRQGKVVRSVSLEEVMSRTWLFFLIAAFFLYRALKDLNRQDFKSMLQTAADHASTKQSLDDPNSKHS